MIALDGTYFLRTNQTGKSGSELWQEYMLQCHVEQAFNELKSDLGIRPVHHHKEDRVDAHVFIPSVLDMKTTVAGKPTHDFRLLSLPLYLVGQTQRLCREMV